MITKEYIINQVFDFDQFGKIGLLKDDYSFREFGRSIRRKFPNYWMSYKNYFENDVKSRRHEYGVYEYLNDNFVVVIFNDGDATTPGGYWWCFIIMQDITIKLFLNSYLDVYWSNNTVNDEIYNYISLIL